MLPDPAIHRSGFYRIRSSIGLNATGPGSYRIHPYRGLDPTGIQNYRPATDWTVQWYSVPVGITTIPGSKLERDLKLPNRFSFLLQHSISCPSFLFSFNYVFIFFFCVSFLLFSYQHICLPLNS